MASPTTIRPFFDKTTGTVSYVISDASRRAAIVDPVLDFDFKSGNTGTQSADLVLTYVREQELVVDWILETHAHADHLSGARYLQDKVGGRIAIGEHIREVQATFKKLYNLERNFLPDGSQFDHLFKDGETFKIGEVEATALLVPGHTPADMAYVIDGAVFVGDTMFMPDVGKQLVFQRLSQIRLRHHPHIGRNERTLKKTCHQRRMIRAQQPPGRMALA